MTYNNPDLHLHWDNVSAFPDSFWGTTQAVALVMLNCAYADYTLLPYA